MSHESWRAVPVLGVSNVKRAVKHYCEVLGFECQSVFEPAADEGAVYAVVTRGDATLHLQIRRRELSAGKRERIESDAYFYVADADALFAELKGKGARIHRDPETEAYGLRDFVVEDLDGHRLVFGSPVNST